MNKSECLRKITGGSNCGSCQVLEIIDANPTEPIEKITNIYCPVGEQPELPKRPKPSIW